MKRFNILVFLILAISFSISLTSFGEEAALITFESEEAFYEVTSSEADPVSASIPETAASLAPKADPAPAAVLLPEAYSASAAVQVPEADPAPAAGLASEADPAPAAGLAPEADPVSAAGPAPATVSRPDNAAETSLPAADPIPSTVSVNKDDKLAAGLSEEDNLAQKTDAQANNAGLANEAQNRGNQANNAGTANETQKTDMPMGDSEEADATNLPSAETALISAETDPATKEEEASDNKASDIMKEPDSKAPEGEDALDIEPLNGGDAPGNTAAAESGDKDTEGGKQTEGEAEKENENSDSDAIDRDEASGSGISDPDQDPDAETSDPDEDPDDETSDPGEDPDGNLLDAPVLKATTTLEKGIKVQWGKIAGASSYVVCRRTETGDWEMIASGIAGTTYTDQTAALGVNYYYTVLAYDKTARQAGRYDPEGTPGIRLGQIKGLAVYKSTRSYTALTWNQLKGAEGYCVFRKTYGGSWELLATVTDEQYYVDRSIELGEKYYYTVRAFSNFSGSLVWDRVSGSVSATAAIRVLMIGNSLTALNSSQSCPAIIKNLAGLNGKTLSINSCVHGGASLYDYTSGKYKSELISKLSSKKYDVIVLQEKSETACYQQSTYYSNIQRMMSLLAAYGQTSAKIVLYAVNGCTHISGISYTAYEQNTLAHLTRAEVWIKSNYKNTDVEISKAGQLHLQVASQYPYTQIMSADGNHPTYQGYYLSSIKLFESIIGQKATTVASGMNTYLKMAHQVMKISSTLATLKVGDTLKLTASDPTGYWISWTSYNTDVATVSSTGKVKAKKKGTAVILAQSSSGLQRTCYIVVK